MAAVSPVALAGPQHDAQVDQAGQVQEAIALGKRATQAQAAALGLQWHEPDPIGHAAPSQAITALMERSGVQPTPEHRSDMEELDRLDEPFRSALTGVVDAFIQFQSAAELAYADVDHGAIRQAQHEGTAEAMDLLGIDLSGVFPARARLLDATQTLLQAAPGPASAQSCGYYAFGQALYLDHNGCDSTYAQDVNLLIDLGGDDTYQNNAGGAWGIRALFNYCSVSSLHLDTSLQNAAALIDAEGNDLYSQEGNDLYGQDRYHDCGNNGGGTYGAGFLFDAAGDDIYSTGARGTNGGGYYGAGMLVDGSGNDIYEAGDYGVNGGAELGAGSLVDLSGDDAYFAEGYDSSNGGARGGLGLLLDGGGTDTYAAEGDDGAWGNGQDETTPKGLSGWQLDANGDLIPEWITDLPELITDDGKVGVEVGEGNSQLPGLATPGVEERSYDAGPVGTSSPCADVPYSLCDKETTVIEGPITVPTPGVGLPLTCVTNIACVGPWTLLEEDEEQVGQPVVVPAPCSVEGALCSGYITLVEEQVVTTPSVGSIQVTDPIGLPVPYMQGYGRLGDPEVTANPHAGETTTFGPREYNVAGVPVVVCPETCPWPVAPEAHASGTVTVSVTVDTVTHTQTVPFAI